MTVPSATNKSGPYSGNGVTTVFAYGFRILDATHIQVVTTTDGVDTIVGSGDYSVSGVGNTSGGDVTFTTAPATGTTVNLIRNAPFTQGVDLENQGAYYAETIEEAFDLAAMRDQQLQEQINRSLKIPVGEDASSLDALIEDVIRLGDSVDNIDTVAGISANVTTVAGIAANVTTVSGIAPNVTTVAGVAADVPTVAGVSTDVTTVAGIAPNVTTVAGVSADVTTVAGVAANVTTVAGVSADVTTVAANVADVTNFADVYLGPAATNPTLRSDGSALQVGDLYFNTTADQMRVYDGAAWVAASSAINGTTRRQSFTATAGQTTFTIAGGYDAGFADVYLNGVKLVNGTDVTVTSGTDVVLTVGAADGDSVDVVAYGAFEVANTLAAPANLGDLLDVAAARTNLGATAVGGAVFTAADAAAARTALALEAGAVTALSANADFTADTGSLATRGVTKTFVDASDVTFRNANMLGWGQTWAFQTRSSLTAYQNTTGRPIGVSLRTGTGASPALEVSIDGVTWIAIAQQGGNEAMNIFGIIPVNYFYRARADNWTELR